MRKLLTMLIIGLLSSSYIYSQSPYVTNAYTFSKYDYYGSARFTGMSGAFGALGGDISSIAINPAGLGVYRSSEVVFTPGMVFNNTNASYLNNTMDQNTYDISLDNIGFVASYDLENSDTRWVNANFSFAYNKSTDLNSELTMRGVNNYSIMEHLVDRANSANKEDWNPFYELMFWEVYLIDTLDNYPDPFVYTSEITDTIGSNPSAFSINQQKVIRREGSIGEYSFAFGANYAHKLYVGASIGIVRLSYKEYASHYEYESANTTDVNNFQSLNLDEVGETSGSGFNLKVGLIYKPIEFVRLGFSFHTPTFYDLEENFYTRVENGTDSYVESDIATYKYSLKTPMKINGSVGLQLGKVALFDVDYEFIDYSKMELDDEENSQGVIDDNQDIQEVYISTHNIRAGAEFRLNSLYFRGGASYSTSPYSDKTINSDNYLFGISGGLGYRQNNFFIDFGFRQLVNDYNYAVLSGNPNMDQAQIKETKNNYVLTIGFKF